MPAFGTGNDDLPTLLREYEAYGGLAVNWRMFGSGRRREQWVVLGADGLYAGPMLLPWKGLACMQRDALLHPCRRLPRQR